MEIENPKCELGYTIEQIERILSDRYAEFTRWMDGQTMALCYTHGGIVYADDLQRFLDGAPIVD